MFACEEYLPLLQFLNKHHYSKPMDPTACPVQPSYSTTQKELELEQRIRSCGSILERRNHGLAHHARSMSFIEPIIKYLETWGSADIRAALADFLGEDAERRKQRIQQLTLSMAFSSINRDSEIPREAQIHVYDYYHQRNGDLFEDFYTSAKLHSESKSEKTEDTIDELPDTVASLFTAAFTSDTEFKQIQNSLVAMGDPSNTDISHIIINLAHKLDLARCYKGSKAQVEIEHYLHRLSDDTKAYGEAMHRLRHYALATLHATGNRVRHLNMPYYPPKFDPCNSNPKKCVDGINSVAPYDTNQHTISEAFRAPFYFKIERSHYKEDSFRKFAHHRSRINYDDFTTRKKRRWTSTDKRKPFGLRLEDEKYKIVDNYTKPPLQKASDKRSKKTSLSYCDPSRGYWPSPSEGISSADIQVGIKLRPDQVTPSLISASNANTRNRKITDFDTKEQADTACHYHMGKHQLLTHASDLVIHGTTQDSKGCKINNEILGRFTDIDSICIFKDNLESRLVAQVRAKQWFESAHEYADEMGIIGPISKPNITFYCVTSDTTIPKLYEYDRTQKNLDLAQASFHTSNAVIDYCLEELFKPAPPSFMEANEVQVWHYAAAHDDTETLNRLLAEDPSRLTQQDKLDRTPMHYAAANACEQSLILLVNRHLESGTPIAGCPLDLLIQDHQTALLDRLFSLADNANVELLYNAISPDMKQYINSEALLAQSTLDEDSTWETTPNFERLAYSLQQISEESKHAYLEKYETQISAYVSKQLELRNVDALNITMDALFSTKYTDLFHLWQSRLGFEFKVEMLEEPLHDSDDDEAKDPHSLLTPKLFEQAETINFIKQLHTLATLALLNNYNKSFYQPGHHRSFEYEIGAVFKETLDTELIECLADIEKITRKGRAFYGPTPLEDTLIFSDYEELCLFTPFTWPTCGQWITNVIDEIFDNLDYYDDTNSVCQRLNERYRQHESSLSSDEKIELITSLHRNLTAIYPQEYVDELIDAITQGLNNKKISVKEHSTQRETHSSPRLFRQPSTGYESPTHTPAALSPPSL
ncbi:MAG: SidE phosphodiesterase domain-containing protein [Coxiellaceae bacterium]|nr:SidE phosphodiesterase domain-containing protein [Coxiellaceae bacterium]